MTDVEIKGPWESTDFRLIIGRSKIDYDWDKEEENRRKHGYSLESAVHLLEGMLLPLGRPEVATSDPIDCGGEIRHQHLTVDDSGKVVFFVTTMRRDETVRVISLRRASDQEEEIYRQACLHGEILVPRKRENPNKPVERDRAIQVPFPNK
jgi:uncharacterized DUF497 family protein